MVTILSALARGNLTLVCFGAGASNSSWNPESKPFGCRQLSRAIRTASGSLPVNSPYLCRTNKSLL